MGVAFTHRYKSPWAPPNAQGAVINKQKLTSAVLSLPTHCWYMCSVCVCARAHMHAHAHVCMWVMQANLLSSFQKLRAETVKHFGEELMLWNQTA